MAWILFTTLCIVYNVVLFVWEGGFNFNVAGRIFWLLAFCFLFLIQVGFISVNSFFKILFQMNEKINVLETETNKVPRLIPNRYKPPVEDNVE